MHDASGLFLFSFMVKAFWGTSDGIAGDGGRKGERPLPAPLRPFAPLCAPLRSVALRSQRFHRWSSKKKGEKFGS